MSRARIRTLLDAGVTFFLDLTEPVDGLEPYYPVLHEEADARGLQVEFRAKPVPDMSVPQSPAYMNEILDTIDDAVARGHRVYLHCWGGVGRTGTVAGCYLVRHGRSGQEALDHLATLWATVGKCDRYPETPQTEAQRRWVRNWAELEPRERTPGNVEDRSDRA